jgi:hypothetical protein
VTALSRLLLAPLRPLRGAARVSRVTPAVESILCAAESRRAWERDLVGWIAREASARPSQREYVAAWRAARVADGLCGSCGRCPRTEGRSVCEGCREAIRAATQRRYAARVARGLCARCGVNPLASATRCGECLVAGAEQAANRYRRRVS